MVAVWQQFMLAFLYKSYNSLLIIAFKKLSGSITMYRLIGLNVYNENKMSPRLIAASLEVIFIAEIVSNQPTMFREGNG